MDLSHAAPKLSSLEPSTAYTSKTLEQLDFLVGELNYMKKRLSEDIDWYRRKREDFGLPEPDMDRLCRALAFPDSLAERVLIDNNIGLYSKSPKANELKMFALELYRSLSHMTPPEYSSTLEPRQSRAMEADVRELVIYAGMYANIDCARLSDSVMGSTYFPHGNPFEWMMDIMSLGGLIIRFKYVSRGGSEPEEKLVSYHPVTNKTGPELAVHIEGDKRFSMRKFWGQGDEKLQPIYDRYKGTIIRWGKNDVRRARDGIEDSKQSFLY